MVNIENFVKNNLLETRNNLFSHELYEKNLNTRLNQIILIKNYYYCDKPTEQKC